MLTSGGEESQKEGIWVGLDSSLNSQVILLYFLDLLLTTGFLILLIEFVA